MDDYHAFTSTAAGVRIGCSLFNWKILRLMKGMKDYEKYIGDDFICSNLCAGKAGGGNFV